jgi:hypothetical protein
MPNVLLPPPPPPSGRPTVGTDAGTSLPTGAPTRHRRRPRAKRHPKITASLPAPGASYCEEQISAHCIRHAINNAWGGPLLPAAMLNEVPQRLAVYSMEETAWKCVA